MTRQYSEGMEFDPDDVDAPLPHEHTCVPCELCNQSTRHTGTKRCDPCWELERRIKHTPEIARLILRNLEKVQITITKVESHGTG